jgi:hypothetical protein
VDVISRYYPLLAELVVVAIIASVVFIRCRNRAEVLQKQVEVAPILERPGDVDSMIAMLKSRLFDFENGSGDDEKDEAIGIILTSGHRYGLASVYELDYDDGIVRIHDLQRSGRRVYIRIRDISAIEGSEDE